MPTHLIPWPFPHISLATDSILDAARTELKQKASSTREKEKQGHRERQFELAAAQNTDRRYRLFLRQSLHNLDVFSVGLSIILPSGDLILCRYNSGHHTHRNKLEAEKVPATTHQHITTQRYINLGSPDGYAVVRTEYVTMQGALALMVKECNIDGVMKPDPQSNFFPL